MKKFKDFMLEEKSEDYFNWNIVSEIKSILEKSIDETFDLITAKSYKSYIKIDRNDYYCSINLTTLSYSFMVELFFSQNNIIIKEYFDESGDLRNNIETNLNIFINQIGEKQKDLFWTFDPKDFIKELPNIEMYKKINNYNL